MPFTQTESYDDATALQLYISAFAAPFLIANLRYINLINNNKNNTLLTPVLPAYHEQNDINSFHIP